MIATRATTTNGDSAAPLTLEEIRFLPDIPPLENDGNNLTLWKYRVEMLLSLQDLWGVVDETNETAPPDATADPKGFAEWKSKDLKARAQITLALKDEPLKFVMDETTARECWKGVSEYCRRTAWLHTSILVRTLFPTSSQATLSDSKPLEPQIKEQLWAARMFSNIPIRFPDNLIAMAIIVSLPPSWSTLKDILLGIEDSKLSTRFVLSSVIEEEQRRIDNSGVDATTYFANAAGKGNGNKNGNRKGKRNEKNK